MSRKVDAMSYLMKEGEVSCFIKCLRKPTPIQQRKQEQIHVISDKHVKSFSVQIINTLSLI
jgi:hypothetical protein